MHQLAALKRLKKKGGGKMKKVEEIGGARGNVRDLALENTSSDR